MHFGEATYSALLPPVSAPHSLGAERCDSARWRVSGYTRWRPPIGSLLEGLPLWAVPCVLTLWRMEDGGWRMEDGELVAVGGRWESDG